MQGSKCWKKSVEKMNQSCLIRNHSSELNATAQDLEYPNHPAFIWGFSVFMHGCTVEQL
jgi:hypothetical protein